MPPDEYDDLLNSLSSGASDPNRLALNNPQVKDFLNRIGQSEGADYHTLVGGTKINDLSHHPNKVGLVTEAGPSTAFGKYQITGTTNRSKLAKYANLDYSPENQDVRAVELLRQTGALDDLYNNDFQSAVKKAGKEWASLPGSTLPGRKNHAAFQQKPATDEYDTLLDSLTQSKPTASTALSPIAPITSTGRGAGMAQAQATTYPSRQTRAQTRKAQSPLGAISSGAGASTELSGLTASVQGEGNLPAPIPSSVPAPPPSANDFEQRQQEADVAAKFQRAGVAPEVSQIVNRELRRQGPGLPPIRKRLAAQGIDPEAADKIINPLQTPKTNMVSRAVAEEGMSPLVATAREMTMPVAIGAARSIAETEHQLANLASGLGAAPNRVSRAIEDEAQRTQATLAQQRATLPENLYQTGAESAGALPVELGKLYAGARLLKVADLPAALNLPVQGALSRTDEGVPGLIKGAAGGLVYHYGGGGTGPYLSRLGNTLLWVGAGAAEAHLVNGVPWSEAIAQSLPMGIIVGGGGEQARVRMEDGSLRLATPRDMPDVISGKLKLEPPGAQSQVQTVPDELQGKLRGGEINQTLAAREAAVTPPMSPEEGTATVVRGILRGQPTAGQIDLPTSERPPTPQIPESLGVVGPTKPVETTPEEGAATTPAGAATASRLPPTSTSGGVSKPYPLADRGTWYSNADYAKRGARMTTMTPDEFLAQAKPLELDEVARDNIDDLKRHIESGKTLDPAALYEDGKTDGRHRAIAAKELSIKDIPVLDFRKQVEPSSEASELQAKPADQSQERSIEAPQLTKAQQRKVSEVPPPETTGIAQRVEQMRRESLGRTEARRGEGVSAADSVNRGRQLLQEGRDPKDAVDNFNQSGAISADAMALVRAKHEELAKAANKAYDEHGIDSPEFKSTEKARQDWWEKSVKPMQTEWSNTGRAQQGETAIDTGTFYGLYRAFKQETGREMTVPEQAKAQRIVDRVATADRGVQETQKALIDQINRATGIADLPPEIQQPLKRLIDQAQREVRTQRRAQSRKTLDDEAATIKTNLAAAFQKVKSQTGVQASGLARLDPEGEITKLAVQYAKNRVKAGVTDVAQLVDEVHAAIKDFADVTRREVAEAISGIGVSREKREPTDWMKTKAELRKGLKVEDQAQKLSDLRDRLSKGGKTTPDDAKTIWQHARENYVDKGAEVGDAIQSTANDLGTTPQQIRRAIANQPKAKRLTNEMYQQMSARRQAQSAAEQWVKNTDRSPGLRALQGTADLFFNLKTFGHGTVGPVTHAGENIFHPTRWVNYIKNVGRTWKSAYSTAAHERYMQDLVNDPTYVTARRAGLANEPGKFYDEYQNTQMQKLFGAVGKIGNRGFDVLKTMRQDFFNARWNKLDENQQTPEMAKVIADLVNHSTGAIRTRLPYPNLTRGVLFAAPLEASRWARILGDPIKATDTFINWKSAKPEEKYFAKAVVKNHAGFLATYLSALAANQAILSATGSNDKVNFTDPSKGDWLRMKILGRAIEPTGGLISTLDFLGKLGQAAIGAPNPKEGRFERMGKATAQYGRGKLSPIASTATDFISQSDFRSRPMPFSADKEREGRPRYSWAEYFLSQQSPIPVAEGAHDWFDEMRKQDVPVSTTKQIFNAVMSHPRALGKGAAIGTLSGSTGVRIGAEYGLTKAQQRKLANQQPNVGQGLQLPPPQRLSP